MRRVCNAGLRLWPSRVPKPITVPMVDPTSISNLYLPLFLGENINICRLRQVLDGKHDGYPIIIALLFSSTPQRLQQEYIDGSKLLLFSTIPHISPRLGNSPLSTISAFHPFQLPQISNIFNMAIPPSNGKTILVTGING